MRLGGIMSIDFEDTTGTEREAYALIRVSLVVDTEKLEKADPDEYGPRVYKPGKKKWSAQSLHHEVVSNCNRNVAQSELEKLANTRQRFPVTITSPTGTTYTGTTWISSFQILSGDQEALKAAIAFEGVTSLEPTVPVVLVPEAILTNFFYTTDPDGSTDGELRSITL